MVWVPAHVERGKSLQGRAVDVVTARGGDVVRLDVGDAVALEIGERGPAEGGGAESWHTLTSVGGVTLVRPAAFTSAILVPVGALRSAHVGHGLEPGYGWFALEDQVLEWAAGPLGASFPAVAPAARLASTEFSALDQELEQALDAAPDRVRAARSARAIRRVAGLRAVRALRQTYEYPYFISTRPAPAAAAPTRKLGERTVYEVTPGRPLELALAGPALLELGVTQDGTPNAEHAELRVVEGGRLRAPWSAARRAIVHVPPGHHRYQVESTGGLLVAPLLAEAAVHLQDARDKSEEAALELARDACNAPASPPLCALSLALLGQDGAGAAGPTRGLSFAAAVASSPAPVGPLAELLASGGPREPSVALEAAGSRGDAAALAALGLLARQATDDPLRLAWAHATARGSDWEIARTEPGAGSWSTVAYGAPGDASCGAQSKQPWPEITGAETELVTTSWHGAQVLDLLVAASCAEPAPVELVVDGERLSANPAAGLVHWHVRVSGEAARVRRLDGGSARVFTLGRQAGPCAPRFETLRAPHVAAFGPELVFEAGAQAGAEIWLREDSALGEVTFSSRAEPGKEGQSVRVVVHRAPGFAAYAESGRRFLRVARVALPDWARAGVRVAGGDAVAVRALVRAPRGAPKQAPNLEPAALPPATPLDESALSALSRAILERPSGERGPLYLERAMVLAAAGARVAAAADAAAAQRLGARGPKGEDAVVLTEQLAHRRAPGAEPLPPGVGAYGIEADFEPGARRCASASGQRAELQNVARELAERSAGAERHRAYDAALAARAVAAEEATPLDPRAAGLVARALAGSRWKLWRDLEHAEPVSRERAPRGEGAVAPDGLLRASVVAGEPFAPGTFATIVAARPVNAVLAGLPRGTHARLELSCAARAAAAAIGAACPLELRIGKAAPTHPRLGEDGRGGLPIPLSGAGTLEVGIHVDEQAPDWVVLARVVFDRKVPGSTELPGVGWLLTPKHLERRYLLAAGQALTVEPKNPGVLRFDAAAEPAANVAVAALPEITLAAGGRERALPADGTTVVVPALPGRPVVVRARGGAVTVAVAERVPADDDEAGVPAGEQPSGEPMQNAPAPGSRWAPASAALVMDLRGSSAHEAWHEQALQSPRPLTRIEASLGTVVGAVGADYGTLRQGSAPGATAEGQLFWMLGYRRRLEAIGLWTDVEVFGRARDGEPTYGGTGILYEDLERLHLRLSSTLTAETQQIAGTRTNTWKSRGFAEYSWRVTGDFFVLPRLGYDGWYTSLPSRPTELAAVDDDVYSAYRVRRPTFLFAQALLWHAAYFNEIAYLRLRGTVDPRASTFSHASARPGAFVVFENLDFAGFLDATWYTPADSLLHRGHLTETAGLATRYAFWADLGSLSVQPGVAALTHLNDGAWQVSVFVNLLASYRRGVRDFSSLELDFPEQRGGGIPWRGDAPGGRR